MLFDTHAHYDDKKFDPDRDEVLQSLKAHEIEYAVNIGTNIPSSEYSVSIAEKYDFLYASVGIHPECADTVNDETINRLRELCKHEKVVAIGETGLDYYWENNPSREIQKEAFKRQIELAKELKLPVIVHNRESTEDMVNILKETRPEKTIIHCVSVSVEIAKILVDMDCYISFAGTLTFKNAPKLREVAKIVPINRLLIETDSPYLSPEPKRGSRNDSRNIMYTAEKLGEIIGLSYKEIASITTENAKRIYNINKGDF
ncbi:MAG: TatD family hydrolase [Clostridia bacterium]|nr:TatD family hydrolase [Clostridia bacterium]